MKCADRKYLLKEAQRTLDESDSTAAFCLCQRWILKDAIALLKEQEAVEPKKESDGNPGKWASWWYVCGNCGEAIDLHDRYCRHCRRAVKWN